MHFKTLVIVFFAALTAASGIDGLASQMPVCARKCFDEDLKKAGCAIDDDRCQCGGINGIANGTSPCLLTSCNSNDQSVLPTEAAKIITETCPDITHEFGIDTSNSALQSLAGVAASVFDGVISAVEPAFTSATGAAGDIFTSATAALGDAYTSATVVMGGIYTSATAAVDGFYTSATAAADGFYTSATAAADGFYTSATAAADGFYTSATAAVGDVLDSAAHGTADVALGVGIVCAVVVLALAP